jgi:hypothetical protein
MALQQTKMDLYAKVSSDRPLRIGGGQSHYNASVSLSMVANISCN